jgi:hypothetical protein
MDSCAICQLPNGTLKSHRKERRPICPECHLMLGPDVTTPPIFAPAPRPPPLSVSTPTDGIRSSPFRTGPSAAPRGPCDGDDPTDIEWVSDETPRGQNLTPLGQNHPVPGPSPTVNSRCTQLEMTDEALAALVRELDRTHPNRNRRAAGDQPTAVGLRPRQRAPTGRVGRTGCVFYYAKCEAHRGIPMPRGSIRQCTTGCKVRCFKPRPVTAAAAAPRTTNALVTEGGRDDIIGSS